MKLPYDEILALVKGKKCLDAFECLAEAGLNPEAAQAFGEPWGFTVSVPWNPVRTPHRFVPCNKDVGELLPHNGRDWLLVFKELFPSDPEDEHSDPGQVVVIVPAELVCSN